MKNQETEVTVRAREGVDLAALAKSDSPLAVPCDTVGPSIAKKSFGGQWSYKGTYTSYPNGCGHSEWG